MKRTMKTVICAVLGLALILGLGAVTFAQEDTLPAAGDLSAGEITVSASGSVRLVPDKASVSFGITTQEASAELAQSANSEAVKNVIAALAGLGVEEKSIRTTNYSMYPQYDYSDSEGQRIVGYTVRTSMSIQDQDLENVGKLLSDCVAAGINSVDNISFLCSGYEEAYHEALTEAVKNARLKAEVLALAAGKTLGDAVVIAEGWQDSSARYERSAGSLAYTADAVANGPSFMPGESVITANVTVTYAMK